MQFKQKQLANGLVIIGEVNNVAQSAAVGFFVKTGSRDEIPQINGVSHFLEHMIFKGTENLSASEVNNAFDRTGAQFNAFTSEENTVYYAAVLPEYLAEITVLWTELMKPALREEDFSVEKNVIKEEIAMYRDHPAYDASDKCKKLHFGDHPCGNSVLGSDESINNLTSGQMRNYFSARYVPNNIAVAIAGNFDWEQISSLVERSCGDRSPKTAERKLQHCSGSKEKLSIEKPNLVREHICLMSPAPSAQDAERFAASLLGLIIGDDVGSHFFWELVDKALADTATMQFGAMDGTGLFSSYICCSPQNTSAVMNVVKNIFSNLSEKGITPDELKKAKNKMLSALVIKNELPMGRLVDLGFNWVYLREYRSIQDDIDAIKAVTADEINSLIKKFNPGDFTQFSTGPAK